MREARKQEKEMCNGYGMMMLEEKKGKRRAKMEKKNIEEASEKKTKKSMEKKICGGEQKIKGEYLNEVGQGDHSRLIDVKMTQ